MDLQPHELKNELVSIRPLTINDFEMLYKAASDPLIWEQHPSKDRYKKEVFDKFFEEAINSQGAFIVYDTKTNEAIGTSRFYDHDEAGKTVAIGFTFLARKYWGTNYNRALKLLMMNYAFDHVDKVIFHIGENNIRSQKAIEKLGAERLEEMQKKYYGERKVENYIYEINREALKKIRV